MKRRLADLWERFIDHPAVELLWPWVVIIAFVLLFSALLRVCGVELGPDDVPVNF